jgi:hypothetical protein
MLTKPPSQKKKIIKRIVYIIKALFLYMHCLDLPKYYPFFNKKRIACFIHGCVFSKIANLFYYIYFYESTVPTQRLIIFWKKIELNYHFCGASTTDYHYLIFPVIFLNFGG